MSFFTPIPRPPATQNCETGIYSGTTPSQICNPNVICGQVCVDVVLDADTAFPQWSVDGAVDVNLTDYVASGTSPFVWTLTAGALPAGLTLVDGHVVGTITDGVSTGTTTFTVTNCLEGTDSITLTWDVAACTPAGPVLPLTANINQPVLGQDYVVTFTATGTTPIVFSISVAPPGASFNTATGVLTWPAASVDSFPHTFQITAQGPCGAPTTQSYEIQASAAITLRYGNLVFGGFPTASPTFVEGDFTGGGPLFASYTEADAQAANTRVGSYAFPGISQTRQVMWIADSLLVGTEQFTVSGFAWGLTPAANTYVQSLTINGIPGKVFFTADRNAGAYTVNVT